MNDGFSPFGRNGRRKSRERLRLQLEKLFRRFSSCGFFVHLAGPHLVLALNEGAGRQDGRPVAAFDVDLAEAQVQRVTDFLGRFLAAWSSFHYTERIVGSGSEPV